MLHAAEIFLERNLHPTVIIRGYVKALEDALAVVDELAFPIDINDREQMLKIIASCIGTKFTSRFGTIMPVSCQGQAWCHLTFMVSLTLTFTLKGR
jgi:T-complex protein 1 subunit gamma